MSFPAHSRLDQEVLPFGLIKIDDSGEACVRHTVGRVKMDCVLVESKVRKFWKKKIGKKIQMARARADQLLFELCVAHRQGTLTGTIQGT